MPNDPRITTGNNQSGKQNQSTTQHDLEQNRERKHTTGTPDPVRDTDLTGHGNRVDDDQQKRGSGTRDRDR
ncbi:hypothetical protein ACFQZQ_13930 [Lysobacter koreensis]|uniref:Uncharacterized protein n=1 Tax=Lysobacter koreensis TaxID=266122 RepID=A0ABW2YPP6_9GAMM